MRATLALLSTIRTTTQPTSLRLFASCSDLLLRQQISKKSSSLSAERRDATAHINTEVRKLRDLLNSVPEETLELIDTQKKAWEPELMEKIILTAKSIEENQSRSDMIKLIDSAQSASYAYKSEKALCKMSPDALKYKKRVEGEVRDALALAIASGSSSLKERERIPVLEALMKLFDDTAQVEEKKAAEEAPSSSSFGMDKR